MQRKLMSEWLGFFLQMERAKRRLLHFSYQYVNKMARTMLLQAGLEKRLWADAMLLRLLHTSRTRVHILHWE